MVDLVHKVKTHLMLKTMHAGLLLHLAANSPTFHSLGKDVSLTQHVMVVAMIHRSIIIMILGVLARLRVD